MTAMRLVGRLSCWPHSFDPIEGFRFVSENQAALIKFVVGRLTYRVGEAGCGAPEQHAASGAQKFMSDQMSGTARGMRRVWEKQQRRE
jgi:hypothetical protein